MVGLVVPELAEPDLPGVAEVVAGALAQRGFNAVLCTRTGSHVGGASTSRCCSSARSPA